MTRLIRSRDDVLGSEINDLGLICPPPTHRQRNPIPVICLTQMLSPLRGVLENS